MVVRGELVAMVAVHMEHLGPEAAATPVVNALEGDVGRCAVILDCLVVPDAAVALVGGNLTQAEILRGPSNLGTNPTP